MYQSQLLNTLYVIAFDFATVIFNKSGGSVDFFYIARNAVLPAESVKVPAVTDKHDVGELAGGIVPEAGDLLSGAYAAPNNGGKLFAVISGGCLAAGQKMLHTHTSFVG